MSFIRVRDQFGNVPPKCSHGIQERVFLQLIPDSQNSPAWDEFTDDNGQRSFPPDSMQLWPSPSGYVIAANEANVNTNYETSRVHVVDLEAAIVDIVVRRKGTTPIPGPITGQGTCEEWRNAVFAIFAKHSFATVGPDNEGQGPNQAPYLRATIDEIKQLHPSPFVQWQFETVGTPKELRPRLFLPHPGSDPFARYADLGDWMMPLKWEHCQ